VKENGVLPENYFTTSNRETRVRVNGSLKEVKDIRMDCAIVVRGKEVLCLEARKVQVGDFVVVGTDGVIEKGDDDFGFMSSGVSSERSAAKAVYEVAVKLKNTRKAAVVAGPAVVHAGGRDALASVIRKGHVKLLLSGNALAVHDIEACLYGTSLGISLKTGRNSHHSNHLWAINRINAAGGIEEAVESGVITDGIMYECVRNNVPFILAGSLRDDGPPEGRDSGHGGSTGQNKRRFERRGLRAHARVHAAFHSSRKHAAGENQSCMR
jgi:lysine-ketoglutarate reductase/saccharopine dehydrogenase-like protein (TIGR00300 family)